MKNIGHSSARSSARRSSQIAGRAERERDLDEKTEECRKAFEKWMDPDGELPRALDRNGKDEYLLVLTAQAWTAWQGAWDASVLSLTEENARLREALTGLLSALDAYGDLKADRNDVEMML